MWEYEKVTGSKVRRVCRVLQTAKFQCSPLQDALSQDATREQICYRAEAQFPSFLYSVESPCKKILTSESIESH